MVAYGKCKCGLTPDVTVVISQTVTEIIVCTFGKCGAMKMLILPLEKVHAKLAFVLNSTLQNGFTY